MVLLLQLLKDCAVTVPVTAVPGYDTVMLVVPCPLTIVAPKGAVHCTDVELAGVVASV